MAACCVRCMHASHGGARRGRLRMRVHGHRSHGVCPRLRLLPQRWRRRQQQLMMSMLLCAAAAATARPTASTNCSRVLHDTVLGFGHNLVPTIHVRTAAECCERCRAINAEHGDGGGPCKSWTLHGAGCHLHTWSVFSLRSSAVALCVIVLASLVNQHSARADWLIPLSCSSAASPRSRRNQVLYLESRTARCPRSPSHRVLRQGPPRHRPAAAVILVTWAASGRSCLPRACHRSAR